MTLKREAIIDGLAGLSKEFTDELNELKSELFDSHGNPIMPDNEADLRESIEKGQRFNQLLQKRNAFWAAKLN